MNRFIQPRLASCAKAAMALLLSAFVQMASAQDFVWAPDFPAGADLPEISALDQDGMLQTFDDLKGENGLLFMLSRSFDW